MTATENEIIRDLALEAARPALLEHGKRYAWRKPDGSIAQVDLSEDTPTWRTGHATVADVTSFAAYWTKHCDDGSEIYADLARGRVTAVLDAHQSPHDSDYPARWQQHRVTLALELTLPWQAWTAADGQLMGQTAFAEFLEDNYRDIAPGAPVKAADLLEIAQQFHTTTKVEFGAGTRLASGQTRFEYTETVAARAGTKGDITVPSEFDLAIAPYDDCPDSVITARFRYRAGQNGLQLGYKLNQPERVRQDAVRAIVARVAEETSRAVLLGTPG